MGELTADGVTVIGHLNELSANTTLPLVALLSEQQLPYAIDLPAPEQQRLTTMTATALALLSKAPAPFFLLIEGGWLTGVPMKTI
nr:alkaline phosphatase [Salinimonas marina]